MAGLELTLVRGELHLPELGLWLDARAVKKESARVVVSHAHSDHTGRHHEVILTAATSGLMEARLGGGNRRLEHVLPFGTMRRFAGLGRPWQITLLPAGHILGSAMALVESEGDSLLYTGDFKLRPGLLAEPCEPRKADLLVMETTFGRPEYHFPPAAEVMRQVVRFCQETLMAGAVPVLLAYSLGKSQELLRSLTDTGLPVVLHPETFRLTKVHEALGVEFPAYERWEETRTPGSVVICPAGSRLVEVLRDSGPVRTAAITGWAMDSSCRFRMGCEAAFPLSDHADFDELLLLVRQVRPRRVYTVHGFAADFAATLRDQGWDARALGMSEQLTLPLGSARSG